MRCSLSSDSQWEDAPRRWRPGTARTEYRRSNKEYSTYEARAVAAGLVLCFTAAIRMFACYPAGRGR
jgi:hypothetical protein